MDLREIDFLVAEKVMDTYMYPGRVVCMPLYSSEIAAAWKIVSELFKDDLVVTIGAYSDKHTEVTIEGDDLIFYAEADTAPLAICLAALKAKGVEIEGEGEK